METGETSGQDNDELIITLFLAAMSVQAGEREQFLREACSGDNILLEELRRRVEWETRMNGFLLTPVIPRDRMDRPFSPGETVLRRFQVLRVAGEGGMGVVYEALDEKLGRRIALKCPRFEFRRRLSPEALNGLRVTHANVCRVFELHTADTNSGEVDFLTMEFLDGETLAARLPKAPPRWLVTPEGEDVARQICAGLKAVHAQGVIHRDLKSNNVMLSSDATGRPRAVIMDFGIAHGEDAFSSNMRGTPAYIAPELWKAEQATPQSDIYALGVLLYEMACGRRPFPEGINWRERLKSLPPAPDIQEPFRATILRCLHPDPQRRFHNIAEVEQALGRGRSRRWLLTGLAGVAVTGAAAAFVKESFWPTSAVRLAILPPLIESPDAGTALIYGFVHDLSYRLKTLRGKRRPLTVYSLAQTASAGLKNSAAAKAIGATHAISIARAGRFLSAELLDVAVARSLRSVERTVNSTELAGQLSSFQFEVVRMTTQQLALQAGQKAKLEQPIPAAAYADYLQGLFLARFDYEKAIQAIPYFEKVIAAAPESALGYTGLAEALLGARNKTGDPSYYGRALSALAKAEQLDPDSAAVHLMTGRLRAANGSYERALDDSRQAAELDPNDAEAFIAMGYLLAMLKRPQEAQAAFQSAIAAQPGYYKSYLDTGQLYYELRDFASAERYWLEAVRLGPGLTRARLNLAAIYQRTGRLPEAEMQARESLKIEKSSSVIELLGDLQEAAGLHTEAAASYKEAVSMSPASYKTWASLGREYRNLGRDADAASAFRQGLGETEKRLAADPRDVEYVAWCAYYHGSLGEVVQAHSRIAEALAAGSIQGNVRKRLVLTFGLLHDIEAALRQLEGAPPDLVKELDNSPDLTFELRQDPRFKQLAR